MAESNRLLVGGTEPTAGQLSFRVTRLASLADAVVDVRGFEEPVHSIISFVWCVGTEMGSSDLMACRHESALPRTLVLTSLAARNATHRAIVSATACNALGDCSFGASGAITVDLDQPKCAAEMCITDGVVVQDEAAWDDVLVLLCAETLSSCTTAPLLSGGERTALRESLIAPLRAHTRAPSQLRQTGQHTLAATWGGFQDASTGLKSSHLLCFGQVGMPLAEHACAQVAASGKAVATIPLVENATYFATLVVSDHVGRTSTFRSAGVTSFQSAPTLSNLLIRPEYGTTPVAYENGTVYSSDCNALHVAWSAMIEPSCASNLTFQWAMCNTLSGCSTAATLPAGALAADRQSAHLVPGRLYRSRLSAAGCSGLVASSLSNGLVCDESAPVLVGSSPQLATLQDGSFLSPRAASLVVSFADVFDDAQSLLARYEVCLVRGDAGKCDGHWHDVGLNTSALIPLPLGANGTLTEASYGAAVRVAWSNAAATLSPVPFAEIRGFDCRGRCA